MEHIEAQGRAATTLARYRSAISANIKPRLGSLAINKVGPAELDRFYGQLAKAGLGPLSVRKSHAILSAAFNQAVKWGWVDVNPVLRASPPSTRSARSARRRRRSCSSCSKRARPPTRTWAASSSWPPPSGARRGELCGLRWSDVDLRPGHHDDRSVHLRRRAGSRGEGHQDPPGPADRPRPGHCGVLRVASSRVVERATKPAWSLAPSAYVWSQDLDASIPYRPDRVTGAFRTLRDRLDLQHVTFHSLRHFTATTLAAGGVGMRTIAGRLGHANPGITLRTYAHFLDAADREAADASRRGSSRPSTRLGTPRPTARWLPPGRRVR